MNYETYKPCCVGECKCSPTFTNLNSVGSWIDCNGMVFAETDDSVNTGHDPNSAVHIMDCVDEWFECLSVKDGVKLFQFLAETKIYEKKDYFKWAMSQMDKVVEANGFNSVTEACIEQGWEI